MNTSGFEALELAAEQLQTICYDALTQAIVKTESRVRDLSHEVFPSLRPNVTRCDFRDLIDLSKTPGNWSIRGNPRLNAQTHLVNEHVELKFLKERSRNYPGGAPPAGRNAARRRFYGMRQDALQLGAAGKERISALILWDYFDPGDREAGVKIRIVEPTEPGRYGKPVPLATSIPLAAGGLIDLSTISFEGDDELLDFFAADISKEENEQESGS